MTSAKSVQGAYLDHAATTPILPEVLDAMLGHLGRGFANPSAIYRAARNERRAIDDARDELAGVLGCDPGEIVFTSGGTEADNLAIRGVVRVGGTNSIIVSAIEHRAVLRPAASIGARNAPVTREGIIDLEQLDAMLDSTTELVSVMAVNNEVGTFQPVAQIVDLVRERAPRAIVHCDAVQAMAWCDVAAITSGCDLVSVSAHKIGGPKGAGALVVRDRARRQMQPILLGGSQERDLRAGTENVAGIVGLGISARLTHDRRPASIERVRLLRDRFVDAVLRELPDAYESVARRLRHVGNAHLVFPGTTNEELLLVLDDFGIAASAGSSCASGALEPSHVLLAMGMTGEEARSSVRFTLGASSTDAEIDHAISGVIAAHHQLVARASQ